MQYLKRKSVHYYSAIFNAVKKLWPRKIILKVVLSNIVVLALTIISLTLYAYLDKTESLQARMAEQYSNYTGKISKLSRNYLADDRIDDLEFLLVSVMSMESDHLLMIKDLGFNPLIALKLEAGRISEFSETNKVIAPVDKEFVQLISKNKLVIWRQIGESNKLGWVYFSKPISTGEIISIEFIKVTLTVLIFAIVVSLVILQRILREPMQSLGRAAEFSQWLDMAQGNRLQLKTSSLEVELLVEKLNYTSEKLFKNGLMQRTRHQLVDTIRDIQTRYIETGDKQALYDHILAKSVNLSRSEYGFFAEVKPGKSGKNILIMKSFSPLHQNISTQNFVTRYSPPGMEFNNVHNLVGVILQTRKPTIANDAQADPRSGGLPPGHPPVYTFMAIPVFYKDEFVAVIGLANRRPSYDQSVIEYLQPFLDTVSNIVAAFRTRDFQMEAAKKLEQQEALHRRILSTVSDSIITINSGGFIDMVNPATENMFGYLREELISQHIETLIPGFSVRDIMDNNSNNGRNHLRDLKGRYKSGQDFLIEFSISEFKIEEEKLFTVTVNDLSHLSGAIPLVQSNENHSVDLQRLIQAGTWLLHVKTGIFKASSGVLNILQTSPGTNVDFKLNQFISMVDEQDRDVLRMAIARCVVDRESFLIELGITTGESQHRYIQMQGKVQDEGENGQTVIAGVLQDFTRFREMLLQKDRFISSVSEEIRSPLATIRGSIGMLTGENSRSLSPFDRDILDTVYRNTDRVLLLVNEILDIENISLGKTKFNMEILEVKTTLESLLARNRVLEKQFNIKFKLNVKAKNMVFFADKFRFSQLITVLLSNAARHSSQGSIVELIAELLDGFMVITVKDTGDGIALDLQPKLFDLYARSEFIQMQQKDNLGLGLCLAKAIVDRLQGSINFQSTPGHGSTFFIQLPVPQQNVAVLNLSS